MEKKMMKKDSLPRGIFKSEDAKSAYEPYEETFDPNSIESLLKQYEEKRDKCRNKLEGIDINSRSYKVYKNLFDRFGDRIEYLQKKLNKLY